MIPASLVVVLTITFAIGTKRMVSRNVIVRKLDALEALGAVTDVCSDKTGTLTQGRMVVRRAWIPGFGLWSLKETTDPFNPNDGKLGFGKGSPVESRLGASEEEGEKGEKEGDTDVDLTREPEGPLEGLLDCAALCNLASVFEERQNDPNAESEKEGEKKWAATGDPTEMCVFTFFFLQSTSLMEMSTVRSKSLLIASIAVDRSFKNAAGNNSPNTPSPPTSKGCPSSTLATPPTIKSTLGWRS